MSDDFDPDAFLAKPAQDFNPDAFLAQPSMATDAIPEQPPERKIGEPTDKERRLGQLVSFLSGSPLFGTVSKAADALTGQRSMQSAQRATDQFSPKVAGVPVLPVLGSMVATAPAGAASIAPRAGAALLGTRGAMVARTGLQGTIGGVQAADRGGDASDVALGTGAGLVGGAIGEGVGAGLTRLGAAARPYLSDLAEAQAVKAFLGGGQIVNRVKDKLGIRSEAQLQALGRQILDEGMLTNALGVPRSTTGLNEANRRMLQSAGGQIGDFVQEADRVAAGLAPGQLGSVNPAQSAEAFRKAVGYASQRSGTAMQSAKEVIPMSSALEEPGLSTFQQMWNTKTQLGTQAFAPTTARVSEKAGLMRAGQQAAARDIEGQMANAIGPDKVDALRASMAQYRLGKRLEGVVEDAATRDMAKSGPGLKDLQVAQTMGATGPLGLPVAMASKFIRGRADSAIAAGANAASRMAPTALGLAGAATRMAAPAATRSQEFNADEQDGIDAFLSGSP